MSARVATSKDQRPREAREAHFEVNASLLEELGERLVSKPEIALAELIKNAYDADASSCTISLSKETIIVRDTGHGMSENEFLRNWMVISSRGKGEQRFSRRYDRAMAGSKGVGRFSARFLGDVADLTTISSNATTGKKSELTATFDWNLIATGETVGSSIVYYYVREVESSAETGTTLTISKLRDQAKLISASTVKTDILRLIKPAAGLESPPFGSARRPNNADEDPGFEVTFVSKSSEDVEKPISDTVASEILSAYVGRVRLEVTESGQLKYDVFWNRSSSPMVSESFSLAQAASPYAARKLRKSAAGEVDPRGLPKDLETIPHLPVATRLGSPVFIDIRFFPRRQGSFTHLSVNGRQANSWILDNASLPVVDHGFAMPSYADHDSDWLAIDASKAKNERSWQSIFTPMFFPMSAAERSDPGRNPMLALPRGRQLVGRVYISTSKRPSTAPEDAESWLQPNMDRESLRANDAYRLLWHIARFAVELIAHYDRKIRLEEEKKQESERRKEVKSALAASISEIRLSEEIEPAHKKRILTQLHEAQDRLKESEAYAERARVSLELMALMGVMAGFMTHEFEKTMAALKDAALSIRKLSSLSPTLQAAAKVVFDTESTLAEYLDYMRLFITRARDPSPQEFKARAQVSMSAKTLGSLMKAHGIELEIDIDPKLPGPRMPIAAYNGVVVNLVSNAMKALASKRSKEGRKIRVYATNADSQHTLVCADSGIGIPEYLRHRIWDPLFTTTANSDNPLESGLGLGLSVVKDVVKEVGGKIELMDVPPPGYSTAFRVVLPLQGAAKGS